MSKSFIVDDDRDVGNRFAEEVKEYLTDSIHKEKEKLGELDKLERYLAEHGYKYERIERFYVDMSGYMYHQIVVFRNGRQWWDVICQRGSFGYEEGLLEGYGELFDEAEGFLTAEDVIARLEEENND